MELLETSLIKLNKKFWTHQGISSNLKLLKLLTPIAILNTLNFYRNSWKGLLIQNYDLQIIKQEDK